MAALRSLMAGELSPVAARVRFQPGSSPPDFPGYQSLWVDSGTSALALALICARQARPEVANPEVILPGYGCPDLVAAAAYAGVEPVLCDIGGDDPAYCLEALRTALNPNVVAVVAVNFLGIAERLSTLREVIQSAGSIAALIEDDAQWFPEPRSALQGDFVTLSLGRGKPVSLLGGGCLLVREADSASYQVACEAVDAGERAPSAGLGWKVKALLFNALQQRHLYRLATRNPWVTVGATYFDPLEKIAPLGARLAFVGASADAYLAQRRWREATLDAQVAKLDGLLGLPGSCRERAGRLLRYPLLCRDRNQRDRLLEKATEQGLGFTAMYRQALPEIAGVAERVRVVGSLVGAKSFADRLLTLPLHDRVSARDVERIGALLRE